MRVKGATMRSARRCKRHMLERIKSKDTSGDASAAIREAERLRRDAVRAAGGDAADGVGGAAGGEDG
eukprot:gene44839-51699_t